MLLGSFIWVSPKDSSKPASSWGQTKSQQAWLATALIDMRHLNNLCIIYGSLESFIRVNVSNTVHD